MDSAQAKLIAVVSLGVGSFFVGLLPGCFAKQSRTQWPLFLSCLLCFGGGVLLCTSVVHILPEAKETARSDYRPYIELCFCAGFFLLYAMDELVHFFYGEVAGHSHQETDVAERARPHHQHHHHHPDAEFLRRHATYGATKSERRTPLTEDEERRQLPFNPNFFRAKSDSALFCDEPPSQLCHVMHREPCQTTVPTANFGLLLALSVHSVLEGLVVGMEGVPAKVLLLLGAVASHKLVVGFCMGLELASNEYVTFCKHFVYILIFAGSSAGGILVGILIASIPSDVMDIVIPVLQALAGGTLLYVTVSEVLPRERARWHQRHQKRAAGMAQLLAVVLGFGIMTTLSKYLGE